MASNSFPRPGHNAGAITNYEHERLTTVAKPDALAGHPNDPAPVFADGTGTRVVKIRAGLLGWLRGSFYESGSTDIALPSLAANTSGQPRVDLVVLRLDRSTYEVKETVLTGTPAANPVAPAMAAGTGSTGFFDLPLAEVRVASGAVALASSTVTTRAWYAGPDGELLCKTSTRPPHATGRSVFDVEAGRWIVSNGTKWLTTADDTGWINLAPASGWRTNRIAIRRFNGVAYLQIDVDRSGPQLPATTPNLVCMIPAGFEPDTIGFFTAAAIWNAQLSGRIAVLPNRRVEISAHPAIPTGRYFIASTSWPIG